MRSALNVVGIGIVLLIGGILLGRYSVSNDVPPLPTRAVPTPINYLEQIEATPEPFAFQDITPTPFPRDLSADLERGRELYQQCIHCHGALGSGEPGNPNPYIPDQFGFMRVPRHDSFGNTWMHPDQLLVEIIKNGAQNPLYRQAMPAYGAVLGDEDIMLILDYIKLFWSEEQREQQAAATERLRLAREGS